MPQRVLWLIPVVCALLVLCVYTPVQQVQSPAPTATPAVARVALPHGLVEVPKAQFVPLAQLNAGSRAAQELQRQWAKMGYPLEVELAGAGIRFRLVPPGEFLMGSRDEDSEAGADERPQHWVVFERPFYMAVFPVTQGQWTAVMGSNPSYFSHEPDSGSRPVDSVSWEDCRSFVHKLENDYGISRIGLPTEAQWEYSCRAGTSDRRYAPGSVLYRGAPGDAVLTHPVGTGIPNAWGLHDMLGNVYEWCADNWHDDYTGATVDGRIWEGRNPSRVARGGAWYYGTRFASSVLRSRFEPGYRHRLLGLRLVVRLD